MFIHMYLTYHHHLVAYPIITGWKPLKSPEIAPLRSFLLFILHRYPTITKFVVSLRFHISLNFQ